MPIKIHPTARVSPLADIEDSVRGSQITIGEGSTVDSFVKIKPTGGTGDVVIGTGSTINANCTLYSGNGIAIGDNVAVAANCVFAATNHAYASADRLIKEQGFLPSKGGIIIEDDVWIGAGCVLLDGTRVGKGAVIAAMSLVRGEIAPFVVVGGNPLVELGHRE